MRQVNPATPQADVPTRTPQKVQRIGCVSYLNARPLIEGLDATGSPAVEFGVPSKLLESLESGQTDIALCPVIDYYRAGEPLEIVPVGGISSIGYTLTVRLCSRIPVDKISVIHADTDSHTSVALVRVLMDRLYGLRPRVADYRTPDRPGSHDEVDPPEAMLLIGDKVVAQAPDEIVYPHQLDLGQTWSFLTGLPFVFAVWMARKGADLGDLPEVLASRLRRNLDRLDEIADRHAPGRNWPKNLAREYLSRIMSYTIGTAELEAIDRFAVAAHSLGLIEQASPWRLRG